MKYNFLFIFFLLLLSCKENDDTVITETPNLTDDILYFPPLNGINWESKEISELKWNASKKNELEAFLDSNDTRGFIVLHKGKIVIEQYWGKNILNSANFDRNTKWYWASAGKTITSFLVGKAQELGLLDITDKTSNYLGEGWTVAPKDKEDLITIQNQLNMTSGLDHNTSSIDCTIDTCLIYKTNSGNQWIYHNAVYTLLQSVVSNSSNTDYNLFTDQQLESKIGMNGNWIKSGYNSIYWSTTRDAARFGLLIASNGDWDQSPIMTDKNYFNEMVNSSQSFNPSYGYLWWLNGKPSITLPLASNSINTSLAPNAPSDLIAAVGKDGQFINIVPSLDLVVVRMGELPDNSLVPVKFHNDMWKIIMEMVD